MSVMNLVEATLTPSGETQIVAGGKEHPKSYVHVGGAVYDVRSVVVKPGAVVPARPSRILFGAINHPRLRMKRPIPVDISVDGKTVVAFCAEIEEFGYGSNLSEALDDFGKTVCELYFSLESHGDKVSQNLREIRSRLAHYLEPRRSKE